MYEQLHSSDRVAELPNLVKELHTWCIYVLFVKCLLAVSTKNPNLVLVWNFLSYCNSS